MITVAATTFASAAIKKVHPAVLRLGVPSPGVPNRTKLHSITRSAPSNLQDPFRLVPRLHSKDPFRLLAFSAVPRLHLHPRFLLSFAGVVLLLLAPVTLFELLKLFPDNKAVQSIAPILKETGGAWARRSGRSTKRHGPSKRSAKVSKSSRGSSSRGRGSKHSRHERGQHSRGRHERGRHHRGRQRTSGHSRRHEEAAKPPKPSPEQLEAMHRRDESYQVMSRAYKLYDQGVNARLSGNFSEAINKLSEAWRLFNDARNYQKTGESSLLEALVHYELGQTAESTGDILTARDSYVRCLNIRPTLVEASVHLVNMLARNGQWQLALAKAEEAVRANPTDPRAHLLLSLALNKTGHAAEAQSESDKAKELLKAVPHYKPYGIDAAVLKRMQAESSIKSESSKPGAVPGPEAHEGGGKASVSGDESEPKKGAGDLSNVMGDEEDSDTDNMGEGANGKSEGTGNDAKTEGKGGKTRKQ